MPRLKNRANPSLRRPSAREAVGAIVDKQRARRDVKFGYENDDDYARAVRALVQESRDHTDRINADAERGMRYYRGEVDYDAPDPSAVADEEDDGRSNIVVHETRDVIDTLLPQIMRIFATTDNAVEFTPQNADASAYARMQTVFCNHQFYQVNNGFVTLHDAIKDALQVKRGIFKHTIEEVVKVRQIDYEGVTQDELAQLEQADDVTVDEKEELGEFPAGPFAIPEMHYRISVTVRERRKKISIVAVPPEEFISHDTSRDTATSPFTGHDRMVTRSYLLGLGYDREIVMGLEAASDDTPDASNARRGRDPFALEDQDDTPPDASQEMVRFVEGYAFIDRDGDGIAEFRRISMGGAGLDIMQDVVQEGRPFTVFSAYRIPHTLIGESSADQTFDLQDISTALTRSMLDNLNYSNVQRIAYIENQVEADDIADHRPGAGIRMRQAGAVQALSIPFTAGGTLPVLEYFDGRREMRTGVSRQSIGLDADALQSSTEVGVKAAVSAGMLKAEFIARIIAETGIGPMFREVARLGHKHFSEGVTIPVEDEFQQIDTQKFDPDTHMRVNVGLGTGQPDVKIQLLMQLAGKLEASFQLMGPVNNPFGDPKNLRNIYEDILKLGGIKNVTRYLPLGVDERMQAWSAAQQQKPDPAMAKAQAEMELKKFVAEQDAQLQQARAAAEANLAEIRAASEARLREAQAAHTAELQRMTAASTADLNAAKQRHEEILAEMRMDAETSLQAARLDHEAALNTARIIHAQKLQELKVAGETELAGVRLEMEGRLEKLAIERKNPSGQGNIPE